MGLWVKCIPINFVDPSGNSWLAIGAVIAGGIAVIAEAIKNNSSNNSSSSHSSGGSYSSSSSGYYDGNGTTTYNMGGESSGSSSSGSYANNFWSYVGAIGNSIFNAIGNMNVTLYNPYDAYSATQVKFRETGAYVQYGFVPGNADVPLFWTGNKGFGNMSSEKASEAYDKIHSGLFSSLPITSVEFIQYQPKVTQVKIVESLLFMNGIDRNSASRQINGEWWNIATLLTNDVEMSRTTSTDVQVYAFLLQSLYRQMGMATDDRAASMIVDGIYWKKTESGTQAINRLFGAEAGTGAYNNETRGRILAILLSGTLNGNSDAIKSDIRSNYEVIFKSTGSYQWIVNDNLRKEEAARQAEIRAAEALLMKQLGEANATHLAVASGLFVGPMPAANNRTNSTVDNQLTLNENQGDNFLQRLKRNYDYVKHYYQVAMSSSDFISYDSAGAAFDISMGYLGANVVGGVVDSALMINEGAGKAEFNGKTVIQNDKLFDPNRIDGKGQTNIQRMQNGRAPIGYDGKPVNMHHIDQTNTGPVMEMSATNHQQNYSNLHQNTGQLPSQINRNEFNLWRNDYWRWRSNGPK